MPKQQRFEPTDPDYEARTGGYAGFTLFGAGDSVLTGKFTMNLLAPADGDKSE